MKAYVYFASAVSISIGGAWAASGCSSSRDASVGESDAANEGTSPVDSGQIVDSSQSDSALVDAAGITAVRLDNDLCLPSPLPVDDSGALSCRVLLDVASGGCSASGLTPLAPADDARVRSVIVQTQGAISLGDLCVIDQVNDDGGCVADLDYGVCYVQGSCVPDAGCAQALCTSNGFDAGASPVYEWLVCP